jgi:ArsR family transcriptional regulator
MSSCLYYNPFMSGSENKAGEATAGAPQMHEVSSVAAALSDPVRLRILGLLVAGRDESCLSPINEEHPEAICPTDLRRKLGGMAGSKLSYHLGELRRTALVREHRSGKNVYYAPNSETLSGFLEALAERYGGA